MITSFPNRAVLNPGGLSAFYFIPYYLVAEIPQLSKGQVVSVLVPKPGFKFLKGYASSDSLKYGEKTRKSGNGTYYEQELQGAYPGDAAEVEALFSEMESLGNQFFVVFVDMLGRMRLAGYAGALEFESNYDSENKRYSFSFSGKALEKAPVYPFAVVF